MEIKERLQDIFRDVFDDDSIVLTDETTASDIEDWDSFAQMNLIVAMEKEFKIKFNVQEINSLKNVGEMISLLQNRI